MILSGKSALSLAVPLLLVILLAVIELGNLSAQEKAAGETASKPDGKQAEEASGENPRGTDTDSGTEEKEDEEYVEPPPPPPKAPRIPIQELRYRVELPLVFEQSLHLGPAFRQSVLSELQELADRSVGGIWDFTIYEPDWLTPRNRAGIEGVSKDGIKWRNRVFSAAESLAELITQTTEGKVEVTVPIPMPAALAESVGKVVAIPNEIEFDDQRKQLLRALVEEIGKGKVEVEKADLIAELMTLYVLPTPQRIDKVFPISVEKRGSYYHVTSREWDRDSETLSPVRSRRTLDRRGVAAEIMRLLGELYHPVGQIDEANPESARIKMRAGLFAAGDPDFAHVTDKSLFKPFFRYLDEDRVLRQMQFLPWSYLTVDKVNRERVETTVYSGVATPLGAFRRRRMEIRAVAIKQDLESTTLRLAPKRNHDRPLVGYLVAVYDEPPPPPLPAGEEPPENAPAPPKPDIYRSDRFGRVRIPVDPNKSLEWVYVRSGSSLLTKFPFVPGAEADMLAECPDDTIRLDVEGQLVLLQSRLIDTIAKRSVVMAMIKNRRAKSEWNKVDESLKELDSLPTLEEFTDEVEGIQFRSKEKAKARNDRRSISRIDRLGREVLKVAAIHLDQEKLDEFREETREMRTLDQAGTDPRERRAAPGS
jgi:hypothetical protein